MRGVAIATAFFILGVVLSPLIPIPWEERVALSDTVIDSTQHVPFDSISVYPDQVIIEHPGLRYAKVSSNSMAPIITDKSTVFEKIPQSPSDIKINDVIAFSTPEEEGTVLHLVTSVVHEAGNVFYKTKGVANDEEDPWLVPYENVKGIMVGTFR